MNHRKATFHLAICLAAAGICRLADAQFFPQPVAGIEIDAGGVLRLRTFTDPTGQLTRQRMAHMKATLPPDLARSSELRKISLPRLEAAIREGLRTGSGVTDEMRFLAGLTRVQYVFVDAEQGDVVIAGPAEGYMLDLSGRAIGMSSGQAILDLQDLVAALRAYPPGAKEPATIRCSIDPTQEGLQRMRQYIASVSGRVTPSDAEPYAEGMRRSLGLQEVTIDGVSPKSHFAQVLVEADYRMKLIGIGLERPPVKIASFIQKASPTDVARNALQRWYFVPNYESVRVSEDGMAMQLVGNGVQLVAEDEMVHADGQRSQTRRINRASHAFVRSFTAHFAELATRVPVYAQLRNVIDLAIVAAFLQQSDLYGQAKWDMSLFADERQVSIENCLVPKTVESAIQVVWKGNTLMTPIGGGVNIQADQAFTAGTLQYDEEGAMDAVRSTASAPQDEPLRWWWD